MALGLVLLSRTGEMLHPLSGCTSMFSPPPFSFFTACRCSSSSVTCVTSVLPRQGWEDGLSPSVPLRCGACPGGSGGRGTAGLVCGLERYGTGCRIRFRGTLIASVPDASVSCVQ